MKIEITNAGPCFCLLQNSLRFQVGNRCIMLVNAGHQHTPWDSLGGSSKDGAPAIVGVIAYLAPVESRHDHGLSRTQQHETMGEQRVVNSLYGRYTPAHARMAKRWRHIGGKRSKPKEWRSSLRVFADPEIANTGQP